MPKATRQTASKVSRLTLAELNRKHEEFWSRQKKIDSDLMDIEGVPESAFELVMRDSRQKAFHRRREYSEVLEDVAAVRPHLLKASRREMARQGGKAPKADALSKIIRAKVQRQPKISQQELIHFLRGSAQSALTVKWRPGEELFRWSEDDELWHKISLSALKSRLSRAKKELR
jgi:hypothetical protein